MKRVLFIVDKYLKGVHPNSLCIESIIKCIDKSVYTIDLLSIEEEFSEIKKEGVYTVFNIRNYGCFKELLRKVKKTLYMPLGSKNLSRKVLKSFSELNSIHAYDAVIAVINPVESAETLYMIKQQYPSIRAIIYEIDPASNRYKNPSNFFQKYWKRKSQQWELKVYNLADAIIHMQSHKIHFSDPMYSIFTYKTFYLDIPAFRISPFFQSKLHRPSQRVKLIYGGAFYPKLREPYFMINVLKTLSTVQSISCDIYTGQSMRSELINMCEGNSSININNSLSQDLFNKKIQECDILLSVGNNDSDFLPSKTLSYMGTGKPIIHFYRDNDDVSLSYFSKYRRVLCVSEKDSISVIVEKISSFIDVVFDGSEYTSFEVLNLLSQNTPEFTANELFNKIIFKN